MGSLIVFIMATFCGVIAFYLISYNSTEGLEGARINCERAKIWVSIAFILILCVHWHMFGM